MKRYRIRITHRSGVKYVMDDMRECVKVFGLAETAITYAKLSFPWKTTNYTIERLTIATNADITDATAIGS